MTGQEPPQPDPTPATISFVDRITAHRAEIMDARVEAVSARLHILAESHRSLVDQQIRTIDQRIDGVEREAAAKRDGLTAMFNQRLDDMDAANQLLAEDLRQVPTDLQAAITAVKELEAVKFTKIDDRFEQNERQTGREKAAADLALAAAFDAQKEAAAATNNANAEAIRKSELATTETIKTNAESQRAGQSSLSDKIDDVKDRMNRLEAVIITLQTERTTQHEWKADSRLTVNMGLAVATIVLAIISTIAVVWGLTGR